MQVHCLSSFLPTTLPMPATPTPIAHIVHCRNRPRFVHVAAGQARPAGPGLGTGPDQHGGPPAEPGEENTCHQNFALAFLVCLTGCHRLETLHRCVSPPGQAEQIVEVLRGAQQRRGHDNQTAAVVLGVDAAGRGRRRRETRDLEVHGAAAVGLAGKLPQDHRATHARGREQALHDHAGGRGDAAVLQTALGFGRDVRCNRFFVCVFRAAFPRCCSRAFLCRPFADDARIAIASLSYIEGWKVGLTGVF